MLGYNRRRRAIQSIELLLCEKFERQSWLAVADENLRCFGETSRRLKR